jgi:hypothetical protein
MSGFAACRKRFMFVSIDAAMASQLVTSRVIRRLQVSSAKQQQQQDVKQQIL